MVRQRVFVAYPDACLGPQGREADSALGVPALSGIVTNGKRRMTITHIAQAERLVAEGERHVARQREIVACIKRRRGRWSCCKHWSWPNRLTLPIANRLQAALAEDADTSR
jgi:hypothetical protein